MAGHSKFKNIQHRKSAQDAKRSKIFTKIIREITTATKSGIDPDSNPRLRTALSIARSKNVPKDRIDKAIKNAEVVAFPELGMEAIYEFDVVDMPVSVAVDSSGISVHQTAPAIWQQKIIDAKNV